MSNTAMARFEGLIESVKQECRAAIAKEREARLKDVRELKREIRQLKKMPDPEGPGTPLSHKPLSRQLGEV